MLQLREKEKRAKAGENSEEKFFAEKMAGYTSETRNEQLINESFI